MNIDDYMERLKEENQALRKQINDEHLVQFAIQRLVICICKEYPLLTRAQAIKAAGWAIGKIYIDSDSWDDAVYYLNSRGHLSLARKRAEYSLQSAWEEKDEH